jgi:hypothetical protein
MININFIDRSTIRSCARGKFLRANSSLFSHVVVAEPPITARYTSAQQDNNPHQQLIGLSTSSACGDIREHKGNFTYSSKKDDEHAGKKNSNFY